MPLISARIATSFGCLASNKSATLGSPPVISFVLDDSLLAEHGETDFSKYADYPFAELIPDFFVPEDAYPVPQVVKDS